MTEANKLKMFKALEAHCGALIREYSDALLGPLDLDTKWQPVLSRRIKEMRGLLADIEAAIA